MTLVRPLFTIQFYFLQGIYPAKGKRNWLSLCDSPLIHIFIQFIMVILGKVPAVKAIFGA